MIILRLKGIGKCKLENLIFQLKFEKQQKKQTKGVKLLTGSDFNAGGVWCEVIEELKNFYSTKEIREKRNERIEKVASKLWRISQFLDYAENKSRRGIMSGEDAMRLQKTKML